LLAARAEQDPRLRAERAVALTAAVLALAGETGGPVCAYVAVGTEPWSVDGLDALIAARHEVLLPVVPPRPAALDWARYDGPASLAPARFGLLEPTGPRLGADAVSRARLVLVPGLAVDRAGTRLGRGAGHYDRTLPLVTPGTRVVMVLDDDELVDTLPAEPHDHPVSGVLLPGSGHVVLGKNG
jgi:5-formyltetrahydrofolate cyclo-ligase